jgi:hypothetical protein
MHTLHKALTAVAHIGRNVNLSAVVGMGHSWRAALLLLLIVASLPGQASAAPRSQANATYRYYHSDNFAFWDTSGSAVYTQGAVDWYSSGGIAPVLRGQLNRGSYVVLNKPGCLWVKVTWNKITPDISWPPSVSGNSVSDGYYRGCGARGAYVLLNGVDHASRTLVGATICIGYSNNATYELRRFTSCKKVWS